MNEIDDNTIVLSNSFLQLPEGQTVYSVVPYQVEHKKYPKWKFWRNEKVKTNFAVMTNEGRFYVLDMDNKTMIEKPNK